MKRVQVLSLWIALSMMPWIAMARTDAFYEQRLKAGKEALSARRGPEAVEELRIAVFGFIDEPRQLAEALAYLAIAQNGLGRAADVEGTLTRFVEAERRSAGYDRQSLPEDVRVQFEALLTRQFARPVLAAIPSIAPVVTGEVPRRTTVPPSVPPVVPPAQSNAPAQTNAPAVPATQPEVRTAPQQNDVRPAQTNPSSPAQTTPRTPQNDARPQQNDVRPPAQQPSSAASTPPAPAQNSVTAVQADPAEQARQMISTRRAAQAATVLTTALEREPQRRELRLLLLQASAMTSDWRTAMAQIGLLRPFVDSEPVFMFYAAVAMWESNRPAEAKELLDRALPRLNRTPYVEAYVKKILPERAAS